MSEPSGSESGLATQGKRRPIATEAAQRLAEELRQHILRNNPEARVKDAHVAGWAVEADRMIRIDKRTEAQIRSLIRWSQNDHFWHKNILSMAKLREQFDRLTLARQSKPHPVEEQLDDIEDTPSGPPQWVGLVDKRERGGGL